MSRRAPSSQARKRARGMTFLWIAVMTAIIVVLLYWEKIALLYVLATFGMTALLVLVALADLGGAKRGLTEPPVPPDDAAAIGTGIASSIPSTASPSTPRAAKRR
jgi:peptidoglycan/LPS O-acetylase OafA/YrhL